MNGDIIIGTQGMPSVGYDPDRPRIEAPPEELYPAGPLPELDALRGELPTAMAFTPATILALVSRRVRALENELAGLIEAFESHTARSDELASQLEALHQVQQRASSKGGDGVKLDEVIASRDQTVEEVLEAAGFPRDSLDLDGERLKAGTLEGLISEKNTELKRQSTGVELIMLRIQTQVTQRGEAITLGTNLIAALDRADRDVIGNIG